MNRWLHNMAELLVHHYNQSSNISRAAAAMGYGLNPYEYTHPYPGSTNNIVMVNDEVAKAKPQPQPQPGRQVPLSLALIGAACVGLATLAACLLLCPPRAGGTALEPAKHEHHDVNLDNEVWERTGNGEWKRSKLTVEQLLKGKK